MRADGYHEVLSVMQTIDLCDLLVFRKTPKGLAVACPNAELPEGPGNLVYRACELLKPLYAGGIDCLIEKRIPLAAGLGGGSSDAATTLKAVNLLYHLGLQNEELQSYASKLGSDVPFFLWGGTALAKGRGELITPLADLPCLWLVLLKPFFGVSTSEIYKSYRPRHRLKKTDLLLDALNKGKIEEILDALGNDLEEITMNNYPQLNFWKQQLLELGAKRALISGSGPTVYGVFLSEQEARSVAAALIGTEQLQTFVCKTVSRKEIKRLIAGLQF